MSSVVCCLSLVRSDLIFGFLQETIDYGDETQDLLSAYSAADINTLGDLSPDAL